MTAGASGRGGGGGGEEEEEEEERELISFFVRLVSTGDKNDPALDGVISHVRQIQAVAALQLHCSNVRSVYFWEEGKKSVCTRHNCGPALSITAPLSLSLFWPTIIFLIIIVIVIIIETRMLTHGRGKC